MMMERMPPQTQFLDDYVGNLKNGSDLEVELGKLGLDRNSPDWKIADVVRKMTLPKNAPTEDSIRLNSGLESMVHGLFFINTWFYSSGRDRY
jgi:hypothetical protein